MKKKVMGIIAVVAVATVAGYNIFTSQNNVRLSNLALSNVEALAGDTEWGTVYCRMSPWTWECKNTVYGTACYCDK